MAVDSAKARGLDISVRNKSAGLTCSLPPSFCSLLPALLPQPLKCRVLRLQACATILGLFGGGVLISQIDLELFISSQRLP